MPSKNALIRAAEESDKKVEIYRDAQTSKFYLIAYQFET